MFSIECFDSSMNLFEQFCINYANEKIQNFCTQRLIYKEQEWYKTEGLNLPEISFPGNDQILGEMTSLLQNLCLFDFLMKKMFKFYVDLLENKSFGIFQLLDNECKMKQPSLKNFMHIVNVTYKNSHLFPKLLPNRANTELNSFIIRHFAQDVQYTTVCIFEISNHVHFLSLHKFIQKDDFFRKILLKIILKSVQIRYCAFSHKLPHYFTLVVEINLPKYQQIGIQE